PGFVGPCRKYSRLVIFSKIGKGVVHSWLIPTGLGHSCFKIVRNKGLRHALIKPKCILRTVYKIFFLLTLTGLNVGILATAQHTNKDFQLLYFPSVPVYYGKFLPGKIEE